jgi:P27 family predicted phage terminase small subunit
MPAGRPPKPTAVKRLQGNPGKRPLPKAEPTPAAGAPSCPRWLSAAARAEWARVVKVLLPLGLVTQADLATLAAYCEAFSEFRAATIMLAAEGPMIRTGGELVQLKPGKLKEWVGGQVQPHPAIARQRTAWTALKAFASLFGLDPSSRTKVRPPSDEEPKDDPFAAWMRGGAPLN